MDELEAKGTKISLRQLSKEIDHGFETVRKLYNDEMERYPRDLLYKLCLYFDCTIEDLLKLEKNENSY